MKSRIALFAFIGGLLAVHALVAWWTPVQGEDWRHWVWQAQHAELSTWSWLYDFVVTHFAFSDLVPYVITQAPIVHAVLTPLVILALVVGIFVLAHRRLPRITSDDVLSLALGSALFWLAQPRAGLALFHMSFVVTYVYGAAVAVWLFAPLRCGWTPPRWAVPLLALAGYFAGTSSRAIATACLVAFVIALRTVPRKRWMWIVFGGLVVGVAAGYVDSPYIEFGRVFRRGLEPNLDILRTPFEEMGELVSLVLAFVLGNLVLAGFGRAHAPSSELPDARQARWWFVAWFATVIWCLFGPRYGDATLVPATVMLVVGAIPVFAWLARSPLLRALMIGLVIGTHAVVWIGSLVTYRDLAPQAAARLATFEQTPRGEVATVPSYPKVLSSFWALGEDFGAAGPRQMVAIGAFGLANIELSPQFRRYEVNPEVEVELVVEGLPSDYVDAAKPTFWAGELSVARTQFDDFVRAMRKRKPNGWTAQLLVKHIEFAQRGTRPLLAAWFDGRDLVVPKVGRGAVQQFSRYTIRIYPPHAKRLTEAWLIAEGTVNPLKMENGAVQVRPIGNGLHVIAFCEPARCLAAEAWVPHF